MAALMDEKLVELVAAYMDPAAFGKPRSEGFDHTTNLSMNRATDAKNYARAILKRISSSGTHWIAPWEATSEQTLAAVGPITAWVRRELDAIHEQYVRLARDEITRAREDGFRQGWLTQSSDELKIMFAALRDAHLKGEG